MPSFLFFVECFFLTLMFLEQIVCESRAKSKQKEKTNAKDIAASNNVVAVKVDCFRLLALGLTRFATCHSYYIKLHFF